MLTLGGRERMFLVAGVTDMRCSFDGLAGLVRSALGEDPACGDWFIFCNRRRTLLKILFRDLSGYWLLAKRLARGTFRWPECEGSSSMTLSAEELAMILGGIDLCTTRQRRWQRRSTHEDRTLSIDTEALMKLVRST